MRQGLRVVLIGALLLLLVPLALSIGPAPAQPADPARQAVRTCPSANSSRERACYERVLLDRLREGGARAALELLDRLAELDDDVRRDGHLYAHGIGIAALDCAGSRSAGSSRAARPAGSRAATTASSSPISSRPGGRGARSRRPASMRFAPITAARAATSGCSSNARTASVTASPCSTATIFGARSFRAIC